MKFSAEIEGEPKRAPKDLISGTVQTNGKFLFEAAPAAARSGVPIGIYSGEAKGKVGFVAINEGKDHLVVFKLGKGTYFQGDDSSRVLSMSATVSRSTDPDCEKGADASIQIADEARAARDALSFKARKCKYGYEWRRKSGVDEFKLSVSEPE